MEGRVREEKGGRREREEEKLTLPLSTLCLFLCSGDDEKIFLVYKKALLSYTYAFLFRDRLDGSLRGTAMLGINRREKYTTIKVYIIIII